MENETRRLLRMIVSALSSGIIAAGGVILGAVGQEGDIKPSVWVLSGVTGVVAMFKDVQSLLSTPPQPHMPPPPQPPLVDSSGQPVR